MWTLQNRRRLEGDPCSVHRGTEREREKKIKVYFEETKVLPENSFLLLSRLENSWMIILLCYDIV